LSFGATTAQNGNRYRAVFNNVVGSDTTSEAFLFITSPPFAPAVTTGPISQTIVAGTPVTFTAAASGSPAPAVQWQASPDGGVTFNNLSGATSTSVTFATNTTLTLATTLAQSGILYRVLFTNTMGSATSGAALLTVTALTTGTNLPPIADPTGAIQTFTTNLSGLDTTGPFFHSLGTNGRTCSTCHQQGDAWTISAADVQARFNQATFDANGVPSDPIFQTVDGSTCDQGMDLTTPTGRARAFTLLTSRGLIRIALPVPANAEFTVDSVVNPYGCSDKATLSMYRRPLPTANLRFLSQVMWDGRESSALNQTQDITQNTNPADLLADLAHQSVSATRIHAQGASDPTSDQQQAIVNFEMQLSVAQAIDSVAGSLQADGATGGPSAIVNQPFSIGINDPLTTTPPFNQNVFTPFSAWVNFPDNTSDGSRKASIARGEIVFNTKSFSVFGVAGLNDVFFKNAPAVATCSFCHNDPNLGNHSLSLPLDIGVAEPGSFLGLSYLPLITLRNKVTGATIQTSDPGVALVTGKWADIGKIKIPILRGLAARAPYFHNGSAQSLSDVVTFYVIRFSVGFTGSEEADLIAFLSSL
jgi:cytochrome c peroxidase